AKGDRSRLVPLDSSTQRALERYATLRDEAFPRQHYSSFFVSATVLRVEDLDATFFVRFLDYLEKERNNTPQSRNVRLAALHSFFHYVALQEPALCAVAQRVLAIPSKRFAKKPVNFLNRAETEALLLATNQNTWSGRRDRAWLLVAVQTGLRISELIQLRCQDVVLTGGAHVRCTVKAGRPAVFRYEKIPWPF